MSVSEAVATRRSIRDFLDTPVDLETLRRVLDQARFAPSGCNYQPWEATIATGEPLRQLQEQMRAAKPQDPQEYDWAAPGASPIYKARLDGVSEGMYGAMGIARDDKAARKDFFVRNVVSFGAPAVLLCYFPRFMGPPQWSDVGMWLQTIMLLLREEGLDSCPQEYLWAHARLIKKFLGVDDETHIFFCGLAIGYRNPDAPVNTFERARVPLDEQVRFMGF
ncbi:MAG: nitroreductase [Sphingobium sp.]|nr:nitroreductase [Sphingobium sp.]MCP5399353.1 nitroreductase [Sphingomonas sp.]